MKHSYYLSDEVVSMLKTWFMIRDGGPYAASPWLFPNKSGTGPRSSLQDAWVRIKNRANIQDGVIHSLRHSFITHFANTGVSLVQLMAYTGHKSVKTALGYIHAAEDNVARRKVAETAAAHNFFQSPARANPSETGGG